MSDLGKYAAKRYLNEVEKRAVTIRRERETKHRTWNFEHWVKEPECVSIRAKDFFADYPGAYKGDHLLLNLLIRFDSWQVSNQLPTLFDSSFTHTWAVFGNHRKARRQTREPTSKQNHREETRD